MKPLYHRGQENIGIYAPNYKDLNLAIRQLPGMKWSQSNRVWYMPFGKVAYDQIVTVLKPLALIDNRSLKQYLDKHSKVKETLLPTSVNPESLPSANQISPRKLPAHTTAWKLSDENRKELNRFLEQLKLKAYSISTIRTYRNEFLQLLQLLKKKPVHELTQYDLRRYMVFTMEKQGISENTAHSRLNALKFYFEQVLGREKFFREIPRPKKPSILT